MMTVEGCALYAAVLTMIEKHKPEVCENPDKVTLGALQVQVSTPQSGVVAVLFAADFGYQSYPGIYVLLTRSVANDLHLKLRELLGAIEVPKELPVWGKAGLDLLIAPKFAAAVHVARDAVTSMYQVTFGRLDLLFEEEISRQDAAIRAPAFAMIEMSQETVIALVSHLSRHFK